MRTTRICLAALAGVVGVLLAATPGQAAAGAWSIDRTPSVPGANDTLNGIAAISGTEAWAVGTRFTPPDANLVSARPLALHLTAAGWQSTTLPAVTANTALFGVGASSASDVWAVGKETASGYRAGKPVILHWNGTAWSASSPLAVGGFLTGVVAISPTNAYAVGTMGRTSPLIERWTGTQWVFVPLPDPDPANPGGTGHLSAISARGADDVWAVGQFSTIAGNSIESGAYALHWDGTTWKSTLMPGPATANAVSVVAVGPGDVWATVVSSGASGDAFIEHWNGTSWSIALTRPATEYPTLTGIAARSATDVWAVGTFLAGVNTPTPVRTTRTFHFDGRSWSIVASPTPSGGADLSGAAASGTHVWASGTAGGSLILSRTD